MPRHDFAAAAAMRPAMAQESRPGMEQFPEQFPRASFGPRKHLLVVAMTRGRFCEAPIPLCRDNRVALLCRVPVLFECTASVLAVEPRLCTRYLPQGCQHYPPSLPHQQAWFPIVTHSQSLKKPCLDLRCNALSCSPPATAMAATDRNATVPLSASVLTGTNRQQLAAAHAIRGCWLE